MHTYLEDHEDEIVRQFVQSSVWTGHMSDGEGDMAELDEYVEWDWLVDTDDFPGIRDEMAATVHDFLGYVSQELSTRELRTYVDHVGGGAGQIGHDFALTRAGHGAGFWDRGAGEIGDVLTDIAEMFRGEGLHGELDPNGDGERDFFLHFD